jgi:hypothetical protein
LYYMLLKIYTKFMRFPWPWDRNVEPFLWLANKTVEAGE